MKNIVIQNSDRVRRITINRPEKRNALNRQTIAELEQAFWLPQGEERCILFSGEGREAFCAGADLKEMLATNSEAERLEFFGGLAKVLKAMSQSAMPIVAKVHGFAFAGGCGLAAASDIVLASSEAQFALPEVKLGLAPMVVMAPLSRSVSHKALAEMVLSGETIKAEQALAMGLVTRIVDKIRLDQEAEDLAKKIATLAPLALKATREGLRDVSEMQYTDLLTDLPKRIAKLSLSSDAREGIEAFFSKRTPNWSGK